MKSVIIVDVDGTIALKHPDRDIYDLTKVHMDLPNEPVIQVISSFIACRYRIIFVSGRSEKCRSETNSWIVKNVPYSLGENLYMRKAGDNRCDTIIKREIYEEHIKGKYNVVAVFDDRPKVIRMWRELGLFVFNCAQHDEEF